MTAQHNPRAFERCLIAGIDPEPTSFDIAARMISAMPIRQQIAFVQQTAKGPDWGQMGYVDSLALDRALVSFAADMDEALHEEDVQLHGPVEQTRYYR